MVKSLLQRRIEHREGAPLAEVLAGLRAVGCSWSTIAERLGICCKTLEIWRRGINDSTSKAP